MNRPHAIAEARIHDLAHLHAIAERLADDDPLLRGIVQDCGLPPLWRRPATFESIARIVLEQHVSLQAASAVAKRLRQLCQGRITASAIAGLGARTMGEAGVTRQKVRCLQELAGHVRNKRLRIGQLRHRHDADVVAELTAYRGIGPWTANIFLMTILQRPDVLPLGDRGLAVGFAERLGRKTPLGRADLEAHSEAWAPFRSVGVHLIWQAYLVRRGIDPVRAARSYAARP